MGSVIGDQLLKMLVAWQICFIALELLPQKKHASQADKKSEVLIHIPVSAKQLDFSNDLSAKTGPLSSQKRHS